MNARDTTTSAVDSTESPWFSRLLITLVVSAIAVYIWSLAVSPSIAILVPWMANRDLTCSATCLSAFMDGVERRSLVVYVPAMVAIQLVVAYRVPQANWSRAHSSMLACIMTGYAAGTILAAMYTASRLH